MSGLSRRRFLALTGGALAVACGAPAAPAPTATAGGGLKDTVAAASREGKLQIYWTSTGTNEWAQRFQAAINERYGTNLAVSHTLGSDWARDTSKVVSEAALGAKPQWDVMCTTEAHHNDLAQAGLLGKHDWKGFGVPSEAIFFNGGAYAFAHQIALPAYNSKIVKTEDVPKAWDDLLDPKWKNKLGVAVTTHHWARLSQVWGDEKTTRFVERLAAQNPRLGVPADLNQQLILGEIHVLATQVDNFVRVAREKGAPVAFAADAQPVLLQSLMVGPLAGGPNPNAALLFAGFLASPKGQELWQAFQQQSSIFAVDSSNWKFVQGKQVVLLRDEFMATELAPRTLKYGKILGYR